MVDPKGGGRASSRPGPPQGPKGGGGAGPPQSPKPAPAVGLQLPVVQTYTAEEDLAFFITATDGSTALQGKSVGTGRDGMSGEGVHGISDVGTGVQGNSASGVGVFGTSNTQPGVLGTSKQSDGVQGQSQSAQHAGVSGSNTSGGMGVWGLSKTNAGVFGTSALYDGIHGESQSAQHAGVSGVNTSAGFGVYGYSDGNSGVVGKSNKFNGGWFESSQAEGVRGLSHNPNHGGVVGICDKSSGIGVFGFCDDGSGTLAGTGVFGKSSQGEGVHGETNSATMAAVAGIMINPSGTGAGLYGESRGKGPAGFFKGDVLVTGDISLINQDCAEDFNISGDAEIEPGTVMVIQQGDVLQMSQCPYDKRVAGVISGAGNLKPAVVLGKQSSPDKRMPLALLGKVYCKVDASYSAVEVGDLLTTSPTPGHAMKAVDPNRAFGAVIGKALGSLDTGQGLIPILVALQ